MVINTNIAFQNINNILRINSDRLATHSERLESGKKINYGSDDPSGLAISSGMKAQIRGINVAMQNLQDGISVLQLQDGALAETHDMLLRMRDLCVRGANEATLTDKDRERMQIELDQLALEITRKSVATTFNTKKVMVGEDIPGGYRVAFDSLRDGMEDVYLMDANGGGQVRFPTGGGPNGLPVISPDGSKILFISSRDGNQEVYVANKDGTNVINLTNNAAADYHASWSPDGQKIVFASTRDGIAEIYTMNKDGSNQQRLTVNNANDGFPFWSPDGSKIMWQTNIWGTSEIATIDLDGTNLQRITNNIETDYTPAYSPDGKKIAWIHDGELRIMSVDGSNQIIIDPTANGIYSRWYPDGNYISYNKFAANREVFRISVEDMSRTNMSNNAAEDTVGWAGSPGPDEQLLQIGPDNSNAERLTITYRDMRAQALGVAGVSVSRQQAAYSGIELVDHAIEVVSNYRSEIGQAQRRLQQIANDLTAQHINTSAAKSRIEDADIADEATGMTQEMIKQQSTTAMSTHAKNIYNNAQELVGIIQNSERVDNFNKSFYA